VKVSSDRGLGAVFSNGADKALMDREVEVHDLHAKIGQD